MLATLWEVLRILVVNILTKPSGFLLAISCAGYGLVLTRHNKLGRWLLGAGLGSYVALLLLPIDNWALRPLEDRFPQVLQPPERVDGIIVLGGGVNPELTAARGIPSLNSAAERMTTFVALAKRHPDARLVFTGGYHATGPISEADAARMLFAQLGLPTRRVVFENAARNTYENVLLSKEVAEPKPGEIWILITSASHMPRAVGVFRQVEWSILPWPVAYKSGGLDADDGWGFAKSLSETLTDIDAAMHEWLALVAYWMMGRTASLFPGVRPTSAEQPGAVDASGTGPVPSGVVTH